MNCRKCAKAGIIFFVLSTVLLIGLEIALRMIYPDKVTTLKKIWESRNTCFLADSDYLVALKPNKKYKFKRTAENGGDVNCWNTNSQGFRGKKLKEHPSLRVIVYGDSNVQAAFSSLEKTFSYQLEDHLKKLLDADTEVINAGISVWTTKVSF
jgi:hypothetical protein